MPDLARGVQQGIFAVLGRANPIAVTTSRSGPGGSLDFITRPAPNGSPSPTCSRTARHCCCPPRAAPASARCTSPPANCRGAVHPLDSERSRAWTLAFQVVDPPVGSATGGGASTYQAVVNGYASYSALLAGETDYADLWAGVG